MTQFNANMFADPEKVSTADPDKPRPSVASFRGRLVMITPLKIETKPSNMNPGQMEDTITADVVVVDGKGAVPAMSYGDPTGKMIEESEFRGMWISPTYLVDQLRKYVGTGQPILGVIDTKVPGTKPMKGNPWGLIPATLEQKQQAVAYLNNRAVHGAAAPAPAPTASIVNQATISHTGPKPGANPFA